MNGGWIRWKWRIWGWMKEEYEENVEYQDEWRMNKRKKKNMRMNEGRKRTKRRIWWWIKDEWEESLGYKDEWRMKVISLNKND